VERAGNAMRALASSLGGKYDGWEVEPLSGEAAAEEIKAWAKSSGLKL
jgi:hypothetical protein